MLAMLSWSMLGTTTGAVLFVHAVLFVTRRLFSPCTDDPGRAGDRRSRRLGIRECDFRVVYHRHAVVDE